MITALVLVALSQAADAPVADVAPDMPGISVHVLVGQPAPFTGTLLADTEDIRRGKKTADCVAELADAKANYVMLPKPAVVALVAIAAAAIATAAGLTVAAAEHKL